MKTKKLGKKIAALVNITIRRQLNNRQIWVPLLNGVKVGVSGEKWMSGVLRELFQFDNGMFYDVGINLGQTLTKVKTLDPSRKYVGFEPNPSCLFYLQRLIAANSWGGCVIAPVGLSNIDSLVELIVSNDTDSEATIVQDLRSAVGKFTKLVPVFRYESIKDRLPKDSVSIIKIDVEGAEIEVVESLFALVLRDRPAIVIEIPPVGKEASSFRSARNKQLVNLFDTAKYAFYRIAKTKDDKYAGVFRTDLLEFADPVLKDHIALPIEKIPLIEKVLTITSPPTRA
jgi:FkbM family methyltransferase